MTCFPSATHLCLALGADSLYADERCVENLALTARVPKPDKYPDDCQGHGTHVAGIVGANGTIKGVAPQVTFGAYRVFGCDGSTDTDIILAALERAKHDGMDVVNMSLGAGFQSWPTYPTSVASDRLWKRGIVVGYNTILDGRK